jgi:hypothetical protein
VEFGGESPREGAPVASGPEEAVENEGGGGGGGRLLRGQLDLFVGEGLGLGSVRVDRRGEEKAPRTPSRGGREEPRAEGGRGPEKCHHADGWSPDHGRDAGVRVMVGKRRGNK